MSKPTEEQKIAAQHRRDKILAEGRCINCLEPRNLYSHHCDVCYEEMAARRRERLGMKPWRKGGRGRPPKAAPDHPRATSKEALIQRILGSPPTGRVA